MIAISGERTLLLKVFARRTSPCQDGVEVHSLADLPHAEVVALFSDRPQVGEIPHTIVVAKSNLREFFAWAATYLGHWSPLTARVRVIPRSEVSDLAIEEHNSAYPRLSSEMIRALSSLMIGELLCEWRLAGEKSAPSLLSLRSTYGYAAVRGLLRGRSAVVELLDAWERAQKILNLPRRRIDRSSLLLVWQSVHSGLIDPHSKPALAGDIGEALAEVVSTRRLPVGYMPTKAPLFANLEAEGRSRREDAVVELEGWLAGRRTNRPIDKFIAACLATRLSQGALTHFDVIAGMTENDSETLLWYSFISGFLASEPSSQVVERLLFRLSGDFDASLEGDISLDELDALTRSGGALPNWVGIGSGHINVDLRRGICVSFRIRDRGAAQSQVADTKADPGKDEQTFDELLDQLRSMYHRRGGPSPRKRRRK
jgi:hypothetical protein